MWAREFAGPSTPLSRRGEGAISGGYFTRIIWPLVALQTPDKFTMSVGLNSVNGAYSHPWDQIMAVTLLSMIPVIIVFLVFQRQFVQGIAESGLK